jgi:hypothetical protein
MKKVFVRRMAKGKRGGNLSIVINGQEIVRSVRKSKPMNPRSQAQMGQRVQLTNILECYRLLRPFLKEAYEKKPDGLNYYNLFIKNNLSKVKVYLSKKEAKVNACVVAPYRISEGTVADDRYAGAGRGAVFFHPLAPIISHDGGDNGRESVESHFEHQSRDAQGRQVVCYSSGVECLP